MMAGPIGVRLREIDEQDHPVLFAHQADPASAAMAGVPSRDWDAFLEHRARVAADPEVVNLAIEVDGAVTGDVLCFISEGRRVVGYRIAQAFWGRGIATAALRELLAVVTERPLYATVLPANAGSRRVLEKSGFRLLSETESDCLYELS
jgi:RimJ/RimL family protein N-acetyltransferase